MSRRTARVWVGGCAVMLLSVLGSISALGREPADAGGLQLGRWQGALEASFDGQEQRTRLGGGPQSDFSLRRARQRFSIRNQGFSVLDPRLLTGNIGLTYDLIRDRQESGAVSTVRTGTLTGYNVDATVLGQKPYNATLYANRTNDLVTQPFGGRSDLSFENRGFVLRMREDNLLRERGILPYFSASLRVHQEQTDELTTLAGQTFRRDDQRDVVTLEAHNGLATEDLDLRYESTDFQNRAYQSGTYQSDVVNVNYSRDFGPTLNRRWDSRIFYSNRTGATNLKHFGIEEQLRLAHHRNLSTTWRYLATRQEVESGVTVINQGMLRLRHQLYANLTTNLEASARHRRLPEGKQQTDYGQADFNYRRGLPGNGQAFARFGGRLQRDLSDLRSSFIQVVDEPHSAPAVLGGDAGFLLDQPFVLVSSIVVVDTRGGARLPTVAGVDYVVVAEGDFTRIVPLPTSAVIQPNDPLAVSYVHEVDPSLSYATTAHWWRAGVEFGWASFSIGSDESRQRLLAGRDSSFLEDRRRDEAAAELRGEWARLQVRAGATFVRYNATRLVYDNQSYRQAIRYRAGSALVLGLSAQQERTDYDLPERQRNGHTERFTLEWITRLGLQVTAYVASSRYRDTRLPPEDLAEANLRLRRFWRKLELNATFGYIHRTRGTLDTTDERIMLVATRRF